MSTTLHIIDDIHKVAAAKWDALFHNAGPANSHAFLACLEDSQSVGNDTGWLPQHALWYDGDALVAAMPGYIKTHSYGEYIFDHGWADAYRRYGLRYYPKWINAIPFTPVTQQRIGLTANNAPSTAQLAADIETFLKEQQLSSAHGLFYNNEEIQPLIDQGWAHRTSVQFEWSNNAYVSFEDFLGELTSRRRRSIKKERKAIAKQNVNITHHYGSQLSSEDMDFFYQCYQTTYLKRSGHTGYLTEAFFSNLLAQCRDNVLLVIAEQDEERVASALYLYNENVLYGRYWGALHEVSGLHFECCYYQGIDFAIANRIQRFNPGTQGEHKILRGFKPITCHSAHFLTHPQMQEAVEDFVTRERPAIEAYRIECESLLPFHCEP